MFSRTSTETLLRLSNQFPVVGVTGPRQSGKSTLVQNAFPDKRYITFDDRETKNLAASNPKDFLNAFPDGLIIDEAQKVPDIFDALKLAVDSGRADPGKYILTGSSRFRLKKNMSDSLAGRGAFLELLPFSISELSDADVLSADPYDLIYKGCFPPLYDPDKTFITDDWFENYIETYLSKDVAEEINISNLSTFRKFVQVCAAHSGRLLSMDGISRNVGVSATTIKSWLSILENSYLIHLLEADTNNLGRSLLKAPKLYFIDTGLLCHLLRLETKEDLLLDHMKGAVVETFAVSEMLKCRTNVAKRSNLAYFRDRKGFEIDIIADWKTTHAIEVKSNTDTEAKLSSNVRKYLTLKNDPKAKGFVFYLGDITMTIDGINYVSWRDWGTL